MTQSSTSAPFALCEYPFIERLSSGAPLLEDCQFVLVVCLAIREVLVVGVTHLRKLPSFYTSDSRREHLSLDPVVRGLLSS